MLRRIGVLATAVLLVAVLMAGAAVSASAAAPREVEPNDAMENANVVAIESAVVGNIDPEGDADWYKFVSPGTTVTIEFNHHGDGIYAYYWYMKIYDEDGFAVLKEGNLSGKEPTTLTLTDLKPSGEYHIMIKRSQGGNPLTSGYSKEDYQLKLTETAPTDEPKDGETAEDGEEKAKTSPSKWLFIVGGGVIVVIILIGIFGKGGYYGGDGGDCGCNGVSPWS